MCLNITLTLPLQSSAGDNAQDQCFSISVVVLRSTMNGVMALQPRPCHVNTHALTIPSTCEPAPSPLYNTINQSIRSLCTSVKLTLFTHISTSYNFNGNGPLDQLWQPSVRADGGGMHGYTRTCISAHSHTQHTYTHHTLTHEDTCLCFSHPYDVWF